MLFYQLMNTMNTMNTQQLHRRINDIKSLLNRHGGLLSHKAVSRELHDDEIADWLKQCKTLTKEVEQIERTKARTGIPADVYKMRQTRLYAVMLSKINRKYDALQAVVERATDWVIDYRMKATPAEYKPWTDENNCRMWLWTVNNKRYAIRQNLDGVLFVIGKMFLGHMEWHVKRFDRPIVKTQFKPENDT